MWGRAQANCIDFINSLVFNVLFQEIWSEHTALEQEFMIGFQCVQYFCERTGNLLDFLLFLSGQFIEVAVIWLTRIDLVADAIQAGHQDR